MYVCIYMYVCVYIYTGICMYVYIYVCMCHTKRYIRGWPKWMFCKAFKKHKLCSSWRVQKYIYIHMYIQPLVIIWGLSQSAKDRNPEMFTKASHKLCSSWRVHLLSGDCQVICDDILFAEARSRAGLPAEFVIENHHYGINYWWWMMIFYHMSPSSLSALLHMCRDALVGQKLRLLSFPQWTWLVSSSGIIDDIPNDETISDWW